MSYEFFGKENALKKIPCPRCGKMEVEVRPPVPGKRKLKTYICKNKKCKTTVFFDKGKSKKKSSSFSGKKRHFGHGKRAAIDVELLKCEADDLGYEVWKEEKTTRMLQFRHTVFEDSVINVWWGTGTVGIAHYSEWQGDYINTKNDITRGNDIDSVVRILSKKAYKVK